MLQRSLRAVGGRVSSILATSFADFLLTR